MSYPDDPGHRDSDSSKEGADFIASATGRLQRLVLGVITDARDIGRTTGEAATRLRIDRGSIQPRTSELKRKGLICDSGARRRNASGVRAIVWVAPAFARAAEGKAA
ncbi:MAG: hypothetical protein ABIS14_12185 [Sphingomonas sp.]